MQKGRNAKTLLKERKRDGEKKTKSRAPVAPPAPKKDPAAGSQRRGAGDTEMARCGTPRPSSSTIAEHRTLVSRARGVWLAAMEGGDPNQGKYQSAYNASLKTLVALEEEQERRLILAKDYISAREAGEAMRELSATVVNRLDKLALDVAEACNPENPAKAVKALEAWVRRVKAELSSHEEG